MTGWELDLQNLSGANISKVDMENFAASAWNLVRLITQQIFIFNPFKLIKTSVSVELSKEDFTTTLVQRITTLTLMLAL